MLSVPSRPSCKENEAYASSHNNRFYLQGHIGLIIWLHMSSLIMISLIKLFYELFFSVFDTFNLSRLSLLLCNVYFITSFYFFSCKSCGIHFSFFPEGHILFVCFLSHFILRAGTACYREIWTWELWGRRLQMEMVMTSLLHSFIYFL